MTGRIIMLLLWIGEPVRPLQSTISRHRSGLRTLFEDLQRGKRDRGWRQFRRDRITQRLALSIGGKAMARITVEDCLEKVSNRFELVLLATKRHASCSMEPSRSLRLLTVRSSRLCGKSQPAKCAGASRRRAKESLKNAAQVNSSRKNASDCLQSKSERSTRSSAGLRSIFDKSPLEAKGDSSINGGLVHGIRSRCKEAVANSGSGSGAGTPRR